MSVWYPLGRKKLMSGSIDFTSHTIKAVLLSTAYVYSASHEFLTDLSGVMATITLSGKTVDDNGVFDASDGIFSVSVAAVKGAIVIYKDTGVSATSPLLAFINEGFAFGTSVVGSQPVSWDDGPNRILA